MCGVKEILECFNNSSFGVGSFSNTSKQACEIFPEFNPDNKSNETAHVYFKFIIIFIYK